MKGTFTSKNPRFGFVNAQDGLTYMIHFDNFNNAFDKDEVEIDIYDTEKLLAKVTKIISRPTTPFYGIVKFLKKNKAIIKINRSNKIVVAKLTKNIILKANDIVSFKIDYSTLKKDDIMVHILHNYGNINNSSNLFSSILESANIPLSFSKESKKEAIQIKRINIDEELKYRKDLRKQATITIDDITAKDLDDAIYLEKKEDKYILYVSIADVSHFVKENSFLDFEAAKRGNSVYLIDKVIPMLPKRISNNLCSLNPNEDKLCFTAKLTYTLDGKLIDSDFFKSIINSKRRLTYDYVNDIFNKKEKKGNEMLFTMLEFSLILRQKKYKNGMINFDIPEIKPILDDKGNIKEIKIRENGLAQNLIENFMVEANCAVAERLFWQGIPAIYRIHEAPSIDSLKELNSKLNLLGYNINNISDIHPGKISKIIENSKYDERAYLIHKTILKSMQRAKYSNEDKGHFGLALDHYLHFTSPIRRYSDLIVHRMLNYSIKAKNINLEKLEKRNQEFISISNHISKTERIAEMLEKDSIKIKLLDYMKKNINKNFKGFISGIISTKVFIQLENYIEVVFYDTDSKMYSILKDKLVDKYGKQYHIGDKINVKIIKLDYEKLEIISEVDI